MPTHPVTVAVLKTSVVLKQLRRAIPGGLDHDVPAGLVYHYAGTDAGLEGILRSKSIWATQFEHLNDKRELVEGDELVHEVAVELCKVPGLNPLQQQIRDHFLLNQKAMAISKLMREFCVASFSEAVDDLPQWTMYAKGGAGYSLGFRFRKTDENGDQVSYLGAVFKQMQYDVAESKAQISVRLIDAFASLERFVVKRQRNLSEEQYLTVMNEGMRACHHRAGVLALRVKNHKFVHEREWRAIVMPRMGAPARVMKFRNNAEGQCVVPYVDLPLVANSRDLLLLDELWVGPIRDQAQRTQYARNLVQSLGYSPDIVKLSTVPLRDPV